MAKQEWDWPPERAETYVRRRGSYSPLRPDPMASPRMTRIANGVWWSAMLLVKIIIGAICGSLIFAAGWVIAFIV